MKYFSMASERGRFLVGDLSAKELGFKPARIWCPSPSRKHRTAPYGLPKTLRIGIRGSVECAAKFSPPPFAVGLEGEDRHAVIGLVAQRGWHCWSEAVFSATRQGLEIRLDLEGHTAPRVAIPHVRILVLEGPASEPFRALLARWCRLAYPAASRAPAQPEPAWWRKPIYCGYGDQVGLSRHLEGAGPEARSLAYCIQGLHERWVGRLDEAEVPVGTVIVDAGWSKAGWWEPYPLQWPDMRGFIERQHRKGRKVLLWIPTWKCEGLPDAWCVRLGGRRLVADPTHPDYQAYLRRQMRRLLSADRDGLNADGFKIDQLAYVPTENTPRGGEQFGRAWQATAAHPRLRLWQEREWGCELLYRLQKMIYRAAKAVKSDALITSSTVHPYFHDTFDMVRLHDTGVSNADVMQGMAARSHLAQAALPNHPIDTDNWVHSDYDLWLHYTTHSYKLGVPSLFYSEWFVSFAPGRPPAVPIPMKDLRRIGASWRAAMRRH